MRLPCGPSLGIRLERVRTPSGERRREAISHQTHHSSPQIFDIEQLREVAFRHRIEEANRRYEAGELAVKRNVEMIFHQIVSRASRIPGWA